jgi:hypothetical protein
MDNLEILDEYVLERILLTCDHNDIVNIYDLYCDFDYWQKICFDKVRVKQSVFIALCAYTPLKGYGIY